ncbi:unnamed protein product [Phytophthora fragariaefolia]|uniref:Unnamed protein product n=1 Tax=Phytophthora fragariaefolia TaxID=1490495 RepID=A0A9W7CTH3_9STRA|nr:unnamed protein product [Phytophthora fragariaefolia]
MFDQLNEDYGLKDQGLLNTYLGIEVEQNDRSIKIHQTKYCEQILERFGFSDAHPSRIPMEAKLRLTVNDTDTASRKEVPRNGKVFPYRELAGSLIKTAAEVPCWYQKPRIVYSKDAVTSDSGTLVLDGFCDSDWGNDPDTRKSVTGYVHCMSGGAISWASRRQTIVAQSTAEAEWLRTQPTVAGCDTLNYAGTTYERDQVAKKTMELWKVKTDVNPSDLMTKLLASERFEMLNDMIGMTKQHLPM